MHYLDEKGTRNYKQVNIFLTSIQLPAATVLWQRAVNRQPGYRSGNSKGRSPSRDYFPENLKFSKNLIIFLLFLKVQTRQNSEISKPFSSFNTISMNFNMCFKTIMVFPMALSVCNILQKLLFRGRIYRGALVPSGSLSCCFGITLLLERNLLPFKLFLI